MTILLPIDAFRLIHQDKLSDILGQNLSMHFTWGEVFKNYTEAEIKAAGIGVLNNAAFHASHTMDAIRDHFGVPVLVHDWYRGNIVHDRQPGFKTHDEAAGGDNFGFHPKGLATDFELRGLDPHEVHDILDPLPFMQHCGLEDVVYNGIHVDSRGTKARFGPRK